MTFRRAFREWKSCLPAYDLCQSSINSRNVWAITQQRGSNFSCWIFFGGKLENRAKYNFHQFINYAWAQTGENKNKCEEMERKLLFNKFLATQRGMAQERTRDEHTCSHLR